MASSCVTGFRPTPVCIFRRRCRFFGGNSWCRFVNVCGKRKVPSFLAGESWCLVDVRDLRTGRSLGPTIILAESNNVILRATAYVLLVARVPFYEADFGIY